MKKKRNRNRAVVFGFYLVSILLGVVNANEKVIKIDSDNKSIGFNVKEGKLVEDLVDDRYSYRILLEEGGRSFYKVFFLDDPEVLAGITNYEIVGEVRVLGHSKDVVGRFASYVAPNTDPKYLYLSQTISDQGVQAKITEADTNWRKFSVPMNLEITKMPRAF